MDEQSSDSDIQGRMAALFQAPETKVEAEPAADEAAPDQTVVESTTEDVEDDGNDDLDVDGNVYRVPKELKAKVSEWKEGHLRREDYTRKTQELADIVRQSQLTAEAIQHRQQFETEVQKERTEHARITSELEQYKQLNWGELDVNQYIKLKGQMDNLKDRAEELKGSINSKAQEFQTKLESHKKKAVEEGQKFLQKTIPNLNADSIKNARGSAMELGYTEGELDNVYDARFVALAWKAAQYDKLQSSKSSAVSSVQKAPPVVKPGAGTGQQGARDQKYLEARKAMKKDGNSIQAAARVFLMRGNK